MTEGGSNKKGNLVSEIRQYADLRIDEVKLKATKGLSTAMSQMLVWFLIIATLAIVLGLLAFALLQWLNSLMGAPWGSLTVAGVFLALLVALLAFRKKLFRDMFVKIFIDVFYDDEQE